MDQSQRTTQKYLMNENKNHKLPNDTVCEEGHYVLFSKHELSRLGKPPLVTYDTTVGRIISTFLTSVQGEKEEEEAVIPTTGTLGQTDRTSRVCDDLLHVSEG